MKGMICLFFNVDGLYIDTYGHALFYILPPIWRWQ